MSRNLFAKPVYKVQISGAIGWSDLKQRVVKFETVEFASRKDAESTTRRMWLRPIAASKCSASCGKEASQGPARWIDASTASRRSRVSVVDLSPQTR